MVLLNDYIEITDLSSFELRLVGRFKIGKKKEIMSKNFKEFKLDNLLTVLLIQDENTPIVSLRGYVRAGSMLEGNHLGSGMSHFLEHIVAGGSTHVRNETEYKQLIATLGGAYNAYTTNDHTCYYINTTKDHTKTAINILYEWLFKNKFSEKEINRERDVILREIEKNNASLARMFYLQCQLNFFKTHPIRYPVIGFEEDFKQLSCENLKEYYKSTYIPSNMILAIGGNFNEEDVLTEIEKTFATEASTAPTTPLIFHEQKPFNSRSIEKEAKTNVTSLSMRFATTDLFDNDLYALDLLEFILGSGENCLLHQKLVEDKKLAYAIHCTSYTPALTTGYFDIACETDYKNIEAIKKEVFSILSKIKHGKLAPQDIKVAIKKKVAEDILSLSHIEDKLARFAQSYLYAHTPTFFESYLNNVKNVTKKDITSTCKKYFDTNRVITTILKPLEKKKNIQKKNIGHNSYPPELITLKNGLKVILKEDHTVPRVYSQLICLGGVRLETKKNNGIGNLIADLIGKKSEKYTKKQIINLIEGNGASLHTQVGNNTFYSILDCLSEDFYNLIPIFKDVVFNAKFPKEELDDLKRQTLQWISQRDDDWHTLCNYRFKKLFYKKHPYHLNALGEKSSIKAITQKDIQNYYQNLFRTKDTVLTIIGDFDRNKTIDLLENHLQDIKLNNTSKIKIDRPHYSQENHTHINIPQNVGAILLAYDGTCFRNTTECIKLDLLNTILSGMAYPTGRLHQELREKGLVYLVHGTNHAGIETGHYLITALTNAKTINDALTVIHNEINKVVTTLPSEQEFNEAIAQIKFYYQDRASSVESLCLMLSTDELYNRGFDYYQKISSILSTLSRNDVIDTAKKYLNNGQLFTFSAENK